MIVANVRRRLQRDDAQLAIRLIARGSPEEHQRAETTLRDGGFDELLDDARLLSALVEARQGACASYPLFAYVVVRHALRSVGEEDRVLADYAAAILMAFGLRDRATRVADTDDERYTTLAELLGAAEGPDGRRNFLVLAHLGNYALWQSGLFPEVITGKHHQRGAPDIDYYEEMGRRGFTLAASHVLAREHGLATVFASAAERFGLLRMGLNRVSDAYLFPHHHSPDRLMRQVRDEARWKLAS